MLLNKLFSRRTRAARSKGSVPAKRVRLQLEALEERALMSAVTFAEPATQDITKVTLAAGDSYRVSGTFRSDPATQVPWYTDIDDYYLPVTPNSLIALKPTTPPETNIVVEPLLYEGHS